MAQLANAPKEAEALVSFLNAAWTPYHAVEEASRRLLDAGFQHLQERDAWDAALEPGGKYFFTRNSTTIVAFAIGKKYTTGNGFYMIGAHTDSPCLKLKPVSKSTKSDCVMLNVETYGGGLWSTWFDRDLGIAGRVLLRGPDGGSLRQRLVRIARPVARIPMLAIHLQSAAERSEGFKINAQNHLAPLLATCPRANLSTAKSATSSSGPSSSAPAPPDVPAAHPSPAVAAALAAMAPKPSTIADRHHPLLLDLLCTELGCRPEEIADLELHLCDTQPAAIGGACDEFVFSGRLDNLAMSHAALTALIRSTGGAAGERALAQEGGVLAVALFDHEEVGSESAQGAGGPVMRDTITRVATVMAKRAQTQAAAASPASASASTSAEGAAERCLRSSFLVSADMAHAVHPNYADKHDPGHGPALNAGLVVKYNGNQRYATNSVSAAIFRELGAARGIPCQEFAVRNDMPCGSTIGPILSSALGCLAVDVGIPQLAMHSVREMCGAADVAHAVRHFAAFFEGAGRMVAGLDLDGPPPVAVPAPGSLPEIADPSCQHCAH
ncbi:hypothetical protein GPECTOR_47g374 [Gonium pectorale]|uniref:aspartyl aminopeptidase n=1 Tax=Gonium pectorale TaxID=33097 RepID=A0A150G8C3_GONPE|nr:hypothetical protein GPECTOR_47g374 [Gonium pectorale]|eukprot:KXZ46097.1 hypothetical protein GPECTOR_47g374 [Gonium pectorale]